MIILLVAVAALPNQGIVSAATAGELLALCRAQRAQVMAASEALAARTVPFAQVDRAFSAALEAFDTALSRVSVVEVLPDHHATIHFVRGYLRSEPLRVKSAVAAQARLGEYLSRLDELIGELEALTDRSPPSERSEDRQRDVLSQVLADPRFQTKGREDYSGQAFQAAAHWLRDLLGTFEGMLETTKGRRLVRVAYVVLYAVLGFAVVGLVIVAYRRARAGGGPPPAPLISGGELPPAAQVPDPEAFRREATAAGASGRWSQAARAWYFFALHTFAAKDLLVLVPGKTNRDYQREIEAMIPGATQAELLATALEQFAYAGVTCRAADVDRVRQAALTLVEQVS